MILKCIAVDDEPLALQILVSYIEQTPSLALVGQFSNAIEALKAIHEQDIDLIFLDIRMPDINGIELAKIVEQYRVKGNLRIIFTTAFDQYALDGYKVDALDYLLKPFSFVDFSKSVAKALGYFELIRNPEQEVQKLSPPIPETEVAYIYLKFEYQLVRIAVDDIIYVESMKDYVKVFRLSEDKPLLSLTSMKSLEEKLPENKFMRIHRSYIVSLDKIKSATKNSVQIDKITIAVTDQYKDNFMKFFQDWA
ncbi:MAG: LytTR family DNA-binding domain-containing protein [Flavobacterium sp.]|jgi:two-component system response regulator LytT|uniref:LytR/AlgR family response regulator transcription factor n=1 Tax=unclassified Flavobacterium TaxID=196869 RepID=UPI000C178539|nr:MULTISPECIES: LytTR family DNA-binding domain-containing protein [unclassified Flavobacterium]MDP3682058.1 LytTR family DNA-binding domain-containing protein [Flavobacterium sp.]MDZ4329106.1 LytTR family DNA-binding domain-containing protein [Flavobacterium sp.]PIF61375.1 LytTR family two component transcriptional regulator [Flavobacterium sp. 11]